MKYRRPPWGTPWVMLSNHTEFCPIWSNRRRCSFPDLEIIDRIYCTFLCTTFSWHIFFVPLFRGTSFFVPLFRGTSLDVPRGTLMAPRSTLCGGTPWVMLSIHTGFHPIWSSRRDAVASLDLEIIDGIYCICLFSVCGLVEEVVFGNPPEVSFTDARTTKKKK